MNGTYFYPKKYRKYVKKTTAQSSQHRICCQNITHHKFLSKHQICLWKETLSQQRIKTL